ncbi:MAG TPA: hypothetical protein VFC46_00900 [Humisphaera sp.]|nr:hypothetical protein [Humisphaera sp.]
MKFMGYFNMAGVMALAVLCAVQWQVNRRVNLQAIDLEKIRQEQVQKIAEQDRTIKGYIADLEDFRHRLEQSDAALRDAENKIATLGAERDAAVAAHDQLKATLEKWVAAVKERDETLNKANDEIRKLAAERNDAIVKFNELAGKYNSAIKELNATRAK